jgi:hypothetical protein
LAALCSEERFVVNEKFVFRRNISVKTRQLLLAANRYKKPFDTVPTWTDSANINGQQTPRAQPHILALSHFSNRVWQPHLKM